MIRILLVDDQNLVQQGIKSLLDREPEIEVIGTVTDGRSAVMQISELHPDIVLLDIEMPGMNGITATKYITHLAPKTKVIILSSHEDKKYLTQALMAGAKGYILKNSLMTDLKQSIVAVNNGYSHIESRLLAKVFDPSNLKSSSSKKAPTTNSKSSRDRMQNAASEIAKTAKSSVAVEAGNIPKSPSIRSEAVTIEPSRRRGRDEDTISASDSNINKAVPKINLPYAVEAHSADSAPGGDRSLLGQIVPVPAGKIRLKPLSALQNFVSRLNNRHRQTFRVTVNGKQYIQQLKNRSAVVKHQARLKQFWNSKILPYKPILDRSRSQIVIFYGQQVMPRLKKWYEKGWLANFGLVVLGLITVMIIHQVFS